MIISPYHWSRYFHFYTLSETKCNNFLLHALLVMLSVEKYRGENLKRVCKLRHVVFVSFCVLLSCFGIGTVGLYLPLMSTSFVALFICEFVLTHPPREQNGRQFGRRFFQSHLYEWKCIYFDYLFQMVQLTIRQHWFRWWLGTEQTISHYLNQWWPSSSTRICVTMGGETTSVFCIIPIQI